MASRMRKLTERLHFQSPNPDAQGSQDGWNEGFTTAGGYDRLRGGEQVQGRRLEGVKPTIITIRNHSNSQTIGTDWKVTDRRTGEVFNIRSIERTPDRGHFEILAESGVAV